MDIKRKNILFLLGILTVLINVHCSKSRDEVAFIKEHDKILYDNEFGRFKGIDHEIDLLIDNSNTDLQKSKSFLLKSSYNSYKNNISEALFYGLESQKFAVKSKDYEAIVTSSRFLSSYFIAINLPEKSINHIKIAEEATLKEPQSQSTLINIAYINDEKSYYNIYIKNYKEAIDILNKNVILIKKINKPEFVRLSMSTFQLLGKCYLELGDYSNARKNFLLSNNFVKREMADDATTVYAVNSYVYNFAGLAITETYDQNFSKAEFYLNKANDYLLSYPTEESKILVYDSFSKYHKALGQYKDVVKYDEYLAQAHAANLKAAKEVYNRLLELSANKEKNQRLRIIYFIVFSSFSVILILFLLFKIRDARRKEKIKYNVFIENFNRKNQVKDNLILNAVQEPVENKKSAPIMLKETEIRISNDLLRLEEELFFLNKNVSLSSLAEELDTNIKYLSFVINTYKKKDFNNYVNELRINYIIHNFKNDPKYLMYKLAHIADVAGFSSHSKFTAYFKTITGMSPSSFIVQLKKNMIL